MFPYYKLFIVIFEIFIQNRNRRLLCRTESDISGHIIFFDDIGNLVLIFITVMITIISFGSLLNKINIIDHLQRLLSHIIK